MGPEILVEPAFFAPFLTAGEQSALKVLGIFLAFTVGSIWMLVEYRHKKTFADVISFSKSANALATATTEGIAKVTKEIHALTESFKDIVVQLKNLSDRDASSTEETTKRLDRHGVKIDTLEKGLSALSNEVTILKTKALCEPPK